MFPIRVLLFLLLSVTVAWAQSSPGFVSGAPLCANYPSAACDNVIPRNPVSLNQAFIAKTDYPVSTNNTGFVWTTPNTTTNGALFDTNSFPISAMFAGTMFSAYHSLVGAVDVPGTSTQSMVSGVAGYARCAAPTVTNCVGVFGAGLMQGNIGINNQTFGSNFFASNSLQTQPVFGAGFDGGVVAQELDCNVLLKGTAQPAGFTNCLVITGTIQGRSISQMNALQITVAPGSPSSWITAIDISDAAASFAMFVGQANPTGTVSPSMPFYFSYTPMPAAGAPVQAQQTFYVDNVGTFKFSGVVAAPAVAVQSLAGGGGAYIDLEPPAGDPSGFVYFDGGTQVWRVGKEGMGTGILFPNSLAIRDTFNNIALQIVTSGSGVTAVDTVSIPQFQSGLPTGGTTDGSVCVAHTGSGATLVKGILYVKTTTGPCL